MRRRIAASGMAQPVAHGSPTIGLPAWIKPQLTQLVEMAPEGDGWLHEIKYDGYRMMARLDHGEARPDKTVSPPISIDPGLSAKPKMIEKTLCHRRRHLRRRRFDANARYICTITEVCENGAQRIAQ